MFRGHACGECLSSLAGEQTVAACLAVRTLGGRTGAIVTRAAALPPTILAELLGIPDTGGSKRYRVAGGG